jgi:hypothetical protein
MTDEITIAELVRNGTMSAAMAGTLWAAVDEGVSFITVAIPQNAGKSTTANAVLQLRPPGVPLHPIADEPERLERLKQERVGGYLVVGEFSPHGARRGYIWGPPVQRVFDTLRAGYSLQSSLHAPGAIDGMHEVTHGNGVSDERAAQLGLVLYIEMFGYWQDPGVRRRLVDLYELHSVERGEPVGRSLFRWRRTDDSFEQLAEPRRFGRDPSDLRERARIIEGLAASGHTTTPHLEEAIAGYRAGARR